MIKARLVEKISLQFLDFVKTNLTALYNKFYGKIFTSVSVHSLDSLYVPLISWLRENNFDKDCKSFRYMTIYDHKTERDTPLFGPNYGTYSMWYQGKPLWVTVAQSDAKVTDDAPSHVQTMETITLTSLSKGNVVQEIILAVYKDWKRKPQKHIEVKAYDGNYWRKAKSLPKSRASGVILAEGVLESLEKELNVWSHSKEWYTSRDVPYRRGYLFHGSPGTGKTSLVKHLAKFLNYNIYVCMAEALSQDNFFKSLSEVPKNTIILIEDIDCLYTNRHSSRAGLIDFASLLNGLDGLVAVEDIVLIMTTNNLDHLDKALIRPGRIDKLVEIGLCTTEQAQRLFLKFFPESVLEINVPEKTLSPAQLQEILLRCENDTDVIVELANGNLQVPVLRRKRTTKKKSTQ